MSSIKLINESEATGKVKELYDEIMNELGIDFVPNMYKVMAHKPDFLETQWRKTRAVMKPGKLDAVVKEIIAVSVSAVMGCTY